MLDESEISGIENLKKSVSAKAEELTAREKNLDIREERLSESQEQLVIRESRIAEKEQELDELQKEIVEHNEYAKHNSYKAFVKDSEIDPLFQRAKKTLEEAEKMKYEQEHMTELLKKYKSSNEHLMADLAQSRRME